jgi:hypothetical protein
VFEIGKRLRDINKEYKLYYNCQLLRIEVWCGDELSFILPYNELDERTLNYARKTLTQNADEILLEIEKNNDDLLMEEKKNREDLKRTLIDFLTYKNKKEN